MKLLNSKTYERFLDTEESMRIKLGGGQDTQSRVSSSPTPYPDRSCNICYLE